MRATSRLDRDRHRARRTIFYHRSCRRRRLLHPIYSLNDQKNAERHDQEVDRNGNETAVSERGKARFPYIGQRHPGCDFIRQRNVEVGEVEIADDSANWRHQQVFNNRGDNFSKGRADDHADGEINCITFDGKFFEFLPHTCMSN